MNEISFKNFFSNAIKYIKLTIMAIIHLAVIFTSDALSTRLPPV